MLKSLIKIILEREKSLYLEKTIFNKKKRIISLENVKNILCIQINAIGDSIQKNKEIS